MANILDFLNSFQVYGNDIDLGFDYCNVVYVNFLGTLLDHGFMISADEKKYLDESFEGAAFIILNNDVLRNPLLFSAEDKPNNGRILELRKQKILKKTQIAAEGIFQIDMICRTKEYNDFISKIIDFSSNTFLPKRIQDVFKKVLEDSAENMNIHLPETLREVIQTYYKRFNESDCAFVVEPHAICDLFLMRSIEHVEDFNVAKEEVRKYLKIDKMP